MDSSVREECIYTHTGTRIAGAFAQNAMSRHPTNELKTVAKIPASRGMPASDKMDAFTIIIYTIVKMT